MALVHVRADGAALRAPRSGDGRDPVRRGRLEIVDIFAQARLVTVSDEVIMLIHDVVLTAWPRLRGWIIAGKDSLVWHQQLDVDTDAWVDADRHKSFLYTGARLELSLLQRDEVNKNYRNLLSADNDRFLDDAIAARAHTRRLRSIGIGVVALLAVVSMITAGISFRQAAALEKERNAAEHTAMMSNILSLQSANPSVAARMLLSGHKRYPATVPSSNGYSGRCRVRWPRRCPGTPRRSTIWPTHVRGSWWRRRAETGRYVCGRRAKAPGSPEICCDAGGFRQLRHRGDVPPDSAATGGGQR